MLTALLTVCCFFGFAKLLLLLLHCCCGEAGEEALIHTMPLISEAPQQLEKGVQSSSSGTQWGGGQASCCGRLM